MNQIKQKFMLQKPILLVFILVITLSILTGCGSDKEASTPDPTPIPDPAPASTPAVPSDNNNNQVQDKKDSIMELINKGSQIDEMYYELVMIGAGLSSDSKSWLKGSKMKLDTTMNGQRLISIFDLSKGELISYMPGETMAMKMTTEEYPALDNTTPIDYVKQLSKNEFVLLETESVNGMECQVIQIASGPSLFKQWISIEHGIVVKVEEDYDGQKTVIDFKNLEIGPGSVSDDVFTLPQGLEIFDMNEMMPNLSDAVSP